MEKLYSCKTASEHFSYSEWYFRGLVRDNLIQFEKIGTSVRFKQSILDKHFLDKQKNTKVIKETKLTKGQYMTSRQKFLESDDFLESCKGIE